MEQMYLISIFIRSMLIFACTITTVLAADTIILLAGQSNMVGAGGVSKITNGSTTHFVWDGVVPPECKSNPLILRLNYNQSWEEAREPLHGVGVGPGMPFANSVLKRDPSGVGVIGLVPCAIGGTKLSEWMNGTNHYSHLLNRSRAAVASGGGQIRAMLWYQGESDTGEMQDAESYKSRLQKFFTDVRTDLQLPSLPIYLVALASGDFEPLIEIVRKAQLETDLPNVTCVDAKGLELEPDGLHLTTAAQVRLGTMLADAFLQAV